MEKELLFHQDKRDKYQEIRYWVRSVNPDLDSIL